MCGQELPRANIQTAENPHKPPAFPLNVESNVARERPPINRSVKFVAWTPPCPGKDECLADEYLDSNWSAGSNRSVEQAFVLLQEGEGKSL